MEMSRISGLRCVVAVISALAAATVFGGNELTNHDFDSDVSGWTVGYPLHGTLEHSDLDAQSSPTSGSALLTNIAGSQWGSHWVSQCLSPSPALTEFDIGAQVMVPSGQASVGNISVLAKFYDSPSCTGSLTQTTATNVLDGSVTDTWLWATATSITPPPGAASAAVQLFFSKEQVSGTLVVHFDNVYFGSVGGIGEIFSDGFEDGDLSAWQ